MRSLGWLASLLVLLPSVSAANDWPQFRNDETHQGAVPAEHNDEFTAFTQQWWKNMTLPGPVGSPSVFRGAVYWGDAKGVLHAYDARTGRELWKNGTGTGSRISGAPAVAADYVYVVTEAGKLYSFDRNTGQVVPNYPLAVAATYGSVLLHEDILYVAGTDGVVRSYFGSTRQLRWTFDSKGSFKFGNETVKCEGGSIDGTPALFEDWLLFGSTNYCFFAIKKSPGTAKSSADWVFKASEAIRSSPAVDRTNRQVVFGDADGYVYAVDVDTSGNASAAWSFQEPRDRGVSTEIKASPAIVDDRVIVAARSGNVRALDLVSGASLWVQPLGGNVTSSPAIANGLAVVGSLDGHAYLLNVADGVVVGTWDAHGEIETSPAISGTQAFWGTKSGRLYAWGGTRESAADLVAIDLTSDRLAANAPGGVYAILSNQGDGPAAASRAVLYVGASEIQRFDVPALEAGEDHQVAAEWNPPLDGPFELRFVVDAADAVDESDEDNNEATLAVDVALAGADEAKDSKKDRKFYEVPGPELPLIALAVLACAWARRGAGREKR